MDGASLPCSSSSRKREKRFHSTTGTCKSSGERAAGTSTLRTAKLRSYHKIDLRTEKGPLGRL
jgi:hypothetical protein